MLEILMAGGWAMVPILVCSAVALAIILERFWSLRRSAVIPAGRATTAAARTVIVSRVRRAVGITRLGPAQRPRRLRLSP